MTIFPELHITESGRPVRTVEVTGVVTVGRDSDNDIVLDEATVSRCHALLLTRPADVLLMDLGSTNGTFVNDIQAPPDESVRLVDGDVITLGQVVLRYHAPLSTEF
jgi:SARP family transcriptional regulator, regulator of embCAB operon